MLNIKLKQIMDMFHLGHENIVLQLGYINCKYIDAVEYFVDEEGYYTNAYQSVWEKYSDYIVTGMEVMGSMLYISISSLDDFTAGRYEDWEEHEESTYEEDYGITNRDFI